MELDFPRPLLAAIAFTNLMSELEGKPAMTTTHFQNYYRKWKPQFEKLVARCDELDLPLISYVRSQVGRGRFPSMLYSDKAVKRFLKWWDDQHGRFPRPSEREAYLQSLEQMPNPLPTMVEEYKQSEARFNALLAQHPYLKKEHLLVMEQHQLSGTFLGLRSFTFELYQKGQLADLTSRRITRDLNHLLRGDNLDRFKELINADRPVPAA